MGDGDGEADPAAEVVRVALLLLPHGGLVRRVPAAQHDQLRAASNISKINMSTVYGNKICKRAARFIANCLDVCSYTDFPGVQASDQP